MKYLQTDIPLFIGIEENSPNDKHEELSHWHNSLELIKVLDGQMCCHVDGKDFLMSKGDFCFINCGRLHRVSGSENKDIPYCVRKVFIFDPKTMIKNEEIYKKYIQPMIEDPAFSHISFHENNPLSVEIFALVDEIEKNMKNKTVAYELEVSALIHMIFRRLYLAYSTYRSSQKERANNIDQQIQRAMTFYVYEHYNQRITLDDIAKAGSVSRSKCSKLFQQFTGRSPIDFVNSYRLEISSELLQTTKKSITSISEACGFSQQSYYNRLFLREFGCTPKAYRQQNAVRQN